MRTAIQATHVILDTAIIPGVSLIPSSLVILKEPISGYNNILLIANDSMSFAKNSEVNKVREINEDKKPEPKVKPEQNKLTLPKDRVPTKEQPKEEKDTEGEDNTNGTEESNVVNPVILFIPGIIIGSLILHLNK